MVCPSICLSVLGSPPVWLATAIKYLSMTDPELEGEAPWVKVEYVEKLHMYKELLCMIHPETDLNKSEDFKGLIFSLY
jgi:hypothetical protein